MVGGFGYEALRQLTNKPVFYFKHKNSWDPTWFFNMVHKFAVQKYPMVVGCCATKGSQGPDGLVKGHAYTLLDAIEV